MTYANLEDQNLNIDLPKYQRIFETIILVQEQWQKIQKIAQEPIHEKELSERERHFIEFIMTSDVEQKEVLYFFDIFQAMLIDHIQALEISQVLNVSKYFQIFEAIGAAQKKWQWWRSLSMEEIKDENARIQKISENNISLTKSVKK